MLSNRFRWVYCQLEALRHCLPPSLRGILEELPETLDGTYERVLREINKANREHARRLLQCLTVASRPLRAEELAEVLAIDFAAPAHGGIPQLNPNWRWTDHHQAVLSTCSSLITIVDDGARQVVQFSHFSVKEFLTSDRLARSSVDVSRYHIALEPAHTILAQACLGVLLRLDDCDVEDNIDDIEDGSDDTGDSHGIDDIPIPLVGYASRHLFDHAGFEKVALHLRDTMEYFFDADKPHWTAWSRVQKVDVKRVWFTPSGGPDDAFPLYYTSLGGFYDLVEYLVGKYPMHIDARGGRMGTPLFAALPGKHFRIAELLHRHGADVNVRGASGYTLLHEVCIAGFLDVVQWLLNHGADVNTQNENGYFPIHAAVGYGRLQLVRMLIEYNADIEARIKFEGGPLHQAASRADINDQVGIMQLLLDHGANPNAGDNNGSTPLHQSSWEEYSERYYDATHGTVEVTRLLLKYGANIDSEDNNGRTPLQLALEHDRQEIAACLREHGATR
jgi:ankyrin repeat protein